MAEAAIMYFLRRLGYQLIQEGNVLSGVQDEIEWIKKEFQAMVAFLRDADKRQQRDETVAGWIKEVRILAFDAEDVIDEFLIQMATTHWNSLYFFKYLKIRYQIGYHIRKIKKQVIEVKERKDRYVVNGLMMCEDALAASSYRGTGGMSSRGPGAASPFVREDDIVGIEHDVEQLMKLVLEGNMKNFLAVSVFGMGGLGKTTLVKEVFKKSKASFDCHSWVFVSQSCNLKDVLRNILFGFIASRGEPALDVMGAMDEGWLLERINEYLQDKKYLLVLDDIWDENLWEELKHAFPRRKGRIIITTRIRGIASLPEDNFQIYDLQPLPYELAWSMFCKKAFRSSQGTCPDDLKEFAEAIVRKCGGLPLAIVAIGGLLSCTGRNSRVWQSVLDTLDWEFNHHRDIERLNKALLFSYNHLPFYLKYCFLYLGLFPEDYEIGRKRLIRMWVAEGFVEGAAQRTEEEVANHYFVQLSDRSMIQAVTIHARDVVKACKLHDLMRDVANQMLKEEKFGSILEEVDNTIQERQRRLAIYEDAESIPSDISKLNLRSLLIFRVNELSFAALQKLLRQLKLVRVLDLQYAPLEKLPNEIGNLIHLRYLDLRGTLIKDLPKSVKNLRNLQTLDVRNTEVKHLPAGINELQHLRHLLLSSFRDREMGFVKMASGGKHFVKLQTLSGIESDEDLVKQLGSLTSLRKLYIGKMTRANSEDFCQSLERMNKLRSLTVLSESPFEQNIQMGSLIKSTKNLEKLKLQLHMKKLPEWFAALNCLHTLYLFKNFLAEDPFPILGKLPSLAILTLASSAYINSIINIPPGGFPKLKLLRILGMENWTSWMPIEKGSMPEIQFLLIADCPRLTSLPDGFNHLNSLDDLTLMGMSLVFAHKLQNRDKWKISHVKEVSIISEDNGQIVKKKLNTSPVN
ncbi:hypothetical protein HAX54_038189 [Datura stramonium]|uniref:Uncharacterized protein n=1 Tax=Datura stramonium TaxID=4076 RepID=A0ABS8RN35_DATST|nr:hypothetical protein [Datura stramonium]